MGASTGRYLIWDFDGTLATRPGEWTGTLCETLSGHRPGLDIDPERIRPHMRAGFPWHTPESVRAPCSAGDWWGWRHLMLSNHVPELTRLVGALGLRTHFTAIYCSADTGFEKPNRQAFERVLAAYPDARDGWMIGDSWSADVQGASRVGLRSILVRRTHANAPLRCEPLREVVSIVSQPRTGSP